MLAQDAGEVATKAVDDLCPDELFRGKSSAFSTSNQAPKASPHKPRLVVAHEDWVLLE